MKTKLIIRVLFLMVLVFVVVKFRGDLLRSFKMFLRNFDFTYSTVVVSLTVATFINEPVRWWLFLKNVDPLVKPGQIYHMTMITSLVSYVFPAKFGVPARIMLSKRILKLDLARASSVISVDSFLSYCLWAAAAMLAVVVLVPGFDISPLYYVSAILLAGFVLTMLLVRSHGNLFRYFPELQKFFLRFVHSIKAISKLVWMSNILLLVVDIMVYGLRHTVILAAMGIEVSVYKVALIVSLSVVAGFVSLMPMGIGGYDLTMVFLLSSAGVRGDVALMLPLVHRFFMMITGIALGVFSMITLWITETLHHRHAT